MALVVGDGVDEALTLISFSCGMQLDGQAGGLLASDCYGDSLGL